MPRPSGWWRNSNRSPRAVCSRRHVRHHSRPEPARCHLRGADLHRDPEGDALIRKPKLRLHDSDHLTNLAREGVTLPDHRLIGAEPGLPEPMAETTTRLSSSSVGSRPCRGWRNGCCLYGCVGWEAEGIRVRVPFMRNPTGAGAARRLYCNMRLSSAIWARWRTRACGVPVTLASLECRPGARAQLKFVVRNVGSSFRHPQPHSAAINNGNGNT